MRLAIDPAFIGRLTANGLFDFIECSDSLERFGIECIRPSGVQLVNLSPRVSPTRCFDYACGFVNGLIAAVGIGL